MSVPAYVYDVCTCLVMCVHVARATTGRIKTRDRRDTAAAAAGMRVCDIASERWMDMLGGGGEVSKYHWILALDAR